MRTLIIDNYDSFTFNLFQLIAVVNQEEPLVIRNDELTWDGVQALRFDNIVLSPGPGRPDVPGDFGVCAEVIRRAAVPLLGVCLGHQGLALAHGGVVRHAPEPVHGRQSAIYHDGSALYAGLPQGFLAVRYHSLLVDPALPEVLSRSAWTAEGLVMGLRHRALPRWGVQFHPESIATEHGERLLRNFRDLSRPARPPRRSPGPAGPASFQLRSRKLAFPAAASAAAFRALYGDAPRAFWLDSSRAERGRSRFSFLGAPGPHGALVRYDGAAEEVTVEAGGPPQRHRERLYPFLQRELARRRCERPDLPFAFHGGFVGYLGYPRAPRQLPDAQLLLADRLIAVDHQEDAAHLLCLGGGGAEEERAAAAWFDEVAARLARLPPPAAPAPHGGPVELRLALPRRAYLAAIARCQRLIYDGQSYELCLTNQLHCSATARPLELYELLRGQNPAPYAAFLRVDALRVLSSSPERFLRVEAAADGALWVESKPIKGTRPRGRTPAEDEALRRDLQLHEKDRSENLMITDLLRNDLGRVCAVGSVHVPALMEVESYQTVHQLVSTVRGRLRPERTALDCVEAAFPGGSMTGAPKLRTMQLLHELEPEPRGVYSGALGYLSLSGAADLSIVIRTLVCTPEDTRLGVGGAVVALSDAEAEFEEALLKARAPLEALLTHARGAEGAARVEQVLADLRAHGRARG